MKKKRFVTRNNKKWKMIDKIFVGLVLLIISSGYLVHIPELIEVYTKYDNVFVLVIWGLMLIISILVMSIPIFTIYFAIRYVVKKRNITNATFDVENDLEYYREILTNVTPATMSLLMDLNLENEKDIGAMKLYYDIHDVYLYDKDGSIYLNNPNKIQINKSDDILLKYFFDYKNKFVVLNEWKENVVLECINNKLITRKGDKAKRLKGFGFGCLTNILSLSFIIYFVLNFEKIITSVDYLTTLSDEVMIFDLFANEPIYLINLLMIFLFIIALTIYISSFSYMFFNFMTNVFMAYKDKFKRTKEGNILAEKLYGLKNFIRDFSNLDMATKNHLVLWKEFLIYAVVLEENQMVLEEISQLYHTNLINYRNR